MTQENNVATLNNGKKTIEEMLLGDDFKKALLKVATKHLTPERMIRLIEGELKANPKLKECTAGSFFSACIQSFQLGLEIGGALGKGYLVPYKNFKTNITTCTYVLGYRGMLDLARRSGEVKNIYACEVCENDFFEYEQGLYPKLVHKPVLKNRGNEIGFYAVAHIKDSIPQFEFMSYEEVLKIKEQSKASSSGPWVSNFTEMAKKTPLRRLFKWLPVSIELQTALALDEQADLGLQKFDNLIDNNGMSEMSFITNDDTNARENITEHGEVLLGQVNTNFTQTPPKTAQVIEQLNNV